MLGYEDAMVFDYYLINGDKMAFISASTYSNDENLYDSLEEYLEYGVQNNIPDINPYEKKAWLSGFAIMFKRMALDNVGLLDLRYGMGYYEDNDICINHLRVGYKQKKSHVASTATWLFN